MKFSLISFLVFFCFSPVHAGNLEKISPEGEALFEFYQSLGVDHLWVSGHHVNWETGEADDPTAKHDIKTHCSAFTASASERLGAYLLRPPEHEQTLLANAQAEWLKTEDAKLKGWKKLDEKDYLILYRKAQSEANEGHLVLAVAENPTPYKPGHIAMVLPFKEDRERLSEEGPQVIQAGALNSSSVSLHDGFKSHLKTWPETVVQFYEFFKPIQIPKK